MLSYLDTQNVMHTRGVSFTLKQYLYIANVVLGEDKSVAYGMIFDTENFNKNIGTEDEDEYLAKVARDAEVMMQQQECQHLYEMLSDEYQSDIQTKATTLKDFKFSGADIQQLLANLLHNRVGDGSSLDDASVKDVIQLIKTMYEQGALDSGDNFQRHFITVAKKYDCICRNCNREMYLVEGCDNRCPACGAIYYWRNNRFYPEVTKL